MLLFCFGVLVRLLPSPALACPCIGRLASFASWHNFIIQQIIFSIFKYDILCGYTTVMSQYFLAAVMGCLSAWLIKENLSAWLMEKLRAWLMQENDYKVENVKNDTETLCMAVVHSKETRVVASLEAKIKKYKASVQKLHATHKKIMCQINDDHSEHMSRMDAQQEKTEGDYNKSVKRSKKRERDLRIILALPAVLVKQTFLAWKNNSTAFRAVKLTFLAWLNNSTYTT